MYVTEGHYVCLRVFKEFLRFCCRASLENAIIFASFCFVYFVIAILLRFLDLILCCLIFVRAVQ
jgi:hypothetical protein